MLAGLSLRLGPGIVVLMGPNGCGKSTLLRALAGLIRLESGSVRWSSGLDDGSVPCEYLPQDYRRALFQWRTVRSNLWPWSVRPAGVSSWPEPSSAALDAALAALNLAGLERRRPGRLSGGQQQLTLLARCVVSPASLAILDEPFSALDVVRRETAAELLRVSALEAGRVMVCAIHEPEQAAELADVVLLTQGPPLRVVATLARSDFGGDVSLFTAAIRPSIRNALSVETTKV